MKKIFLLVFMLVFCLSFINVVNANVLHYTGLSYSVQAEDPTTKGIFYNGTNWFLSEKMEWMEDSRGHYILLYDSNWEYLGIKFNVTAQAGQPGSIYFDGTYWYLVNSNPPPVGVYVYDANWNYIGIFHDLNIEGFYPINSLYFDGNYWYLSGMINSVGMIVVFDTNWNYVTSHNVNQQARNPGGVYFDGINWFVAGGFASIGYKHIFVYDFNWNYVSSYDVSLDGLTHPADIRTYDGVNLFILGSNNVVQVYNFVECGDNNDCSLCEKCVDNFCVNQTSDEDLKDECELNFTTCFNDYIKQGSDGFCDGYGSCDINNNLLNVSEGNVCYNGNDINPYADVNCDIWIDCIKDEVSANNYYVGYNGDGTNNCIGTDWILIGENWFAPEGNSINETSIELLNCSFDEFSLPIVILEIQGSIYKINPFNITYSTSNLNGINYTNVLFKINLSRSIPFEIGTKKSDIFNVTYIKHSNGVETSGEMIYNTFELIDGKFVGYYGDIINGFPLPINYDATTIFTIKMNKSAPLDNYKLSVELYDLSENESLSIAQDSFEVKKYITSTGSVVSNLNIENRIMTLITILLVFSLAVFMYSKFHKKGMSKIGKSKLGIYLIIGLCFTTKVLAQTYDYARENMLLNIVTIFLIIGLIYFLYQKFFKGK